MIDERGYRYERCAICGDWVNVAIRQTIPDDGYACPRCRRGSLSPLRRTAPSQRGPK